MLSNMLKAWNEKLQISRCIHSPGALKLLPTWECTSKIAWMCSLEVWSDRFIFKALLLKYSSFAWQMTRLSKGKDQSCRNNKKIIGTQFTSLSCQPFLLAFHTTKQRVKVLDVKTWEIPRDRALASTNVLAMELIPVTFSIMIIPQRKLKPFSKTWPMEFQR